MIIKKLTITITKMILITRISLSFKIIMTTSVTRPCFTTQHQTCKTKTKTTAYKTKTDFLVSDRSCPKADGLRPHRITTAADMGRTATEAD